MEVGEEEILYTYRYTVTTRMTPRIKMGSDGGLVEANQFDILSRSKGVTESCSSCNNA